MAGYQNYSLSNNAVRAYQKGLLPKSKANAVAKALLKILSFKYQIPIDLSDFCVSDYCAEEWHHTSKKYNCTDFYDPFWLAKRELIKQLDGEYSNIADSQDELEAMVEDLRDLCEFDYCMKNKELISLTLEKLEELEK